MNFSIKDFFSRCDQNFIFCAVPGVKGYKTTKICYIVSTVAVADAFIFVVLKKNFKQFPYTN